MNYFNATQFCKCIPVLLQKNRMLEPSALSAKRAVLCTKARNVTTGQAEKMAADLKLIGFLLLSFNYSTYLFCQRLCIRLTALRRFIILYYIIIMTKILAHKLLD